MRQSEPYAPSPWTEALLHPLLLVRRAFRLFFRRTVLGLGVLGFGVASRTGTRLLMVSGRMFRGRVLWDCAFRCRVVRRGRVVRGRVLRHRAFCRAIRWPRIHLGVLRRLRRVLLRPRGGCPRVNMTGRSVVPFSVLVR
jgi:hypothetical protein